MRSPVLRRMGLSCKEEGRHLAQGTIPLRRVKKMLDRLFTLNSTSL